MSTTNRVIDEGAESIVTLITLGDDMSTVTKTRKPQGKTQYLFEAFSYKSVAELGSHVPIVIHVSENQLTMSAFTGELLSLTMTNTS